MYIHNKILLIMHAASYPPPYVPQYIGMKKGIINVKFNLKEYILINTCILMNVKIGTEEAFNSSLDLYRYFRYSS